MSFASAGTSRAVQDFEFHWGNPRPQGNELTGVAFESASRGYTVGLRGTVLTTEDGGSTWTDLTNWPVFPKDLKDLVVLGPGHLLAVGEHPGIYRSLDGGATWTAVANPSTQTLNELSWIDGGLLSAVGDRGEILRSGDQGASWVPLNGPGSDRNIDDQFWKTPDHGYVIGSLLLRQTTNGGASWTAVPGASENNFFPGDIQFLDDQNGWILVDFTTYRTTNGGVSWFERHGQIGDSPIYQEEALIVDSNRRFVISEAEGAEIWWTEDDGLHWTHLYSRPVTRGYTAITSPAGGRLIVVSTDGDLLWSDDQGENWTNFTRAPGDGHRVNFGAIASLPGGHGIAGGSPSFGNEPGLFMHTTDEGRTWEEMPSAPNGITPTTICFRDDQLGIVGGWASGGQSRVERTTDGGATWTSHLLFPTYVGYAMDIVFASPIRCYAAVYGGLNINAVYSSTDAGATWFRASTGIPTSQRMECVSFIDENTGFAAGGESGPKVYKTTNGGQSWSDVTGAGLQTDMVRDMHWFSENEGIAGGLSGIFRTTNGGALWQRVVADYIARIDFEDDLVGYACNLLEPVVWMTSDGGANWESIDLCWTGGTECIAAFPRGFTVASRASMILNAEFVDPTSVDADEDAPHRRSAWLREDLGPGLQVRLLTPPVSVRGSEVVLAVRAGPSSEGSIPPAGAVYNLQGAGVAAMASRQLDRLTWELTWSGRAHDGTAVPSGIYFVRLTRGAAGASGRLIVVR